MSNRTLYVRDAAVFVLLTLAVNAIVFSLGWNEDGASRTRVSPPGWVVGAVWVVLLAMLGCAHARLRQAAESGHIARRMIQVLLALCLAYPFYTAGFSSDQAALVGNFVVLAWAIATLVMVAHADRIAGGLIAPMLLWIGYANVIVGAALA
jgi:benzodiazapine receptor